MHRYWKRSLALVALAGLGVFAGIFIPAGHATPATHQATMKINVVMNEWSFKLSKKTVPVGTTVVFKVTNKGKIGHDFRINGKKTKLLAPGKSATLTVKFQKTGKFPYLCTVPGHAASGMKGTFTVK